MALLVAGCVAVFSDNVQAATDDSTEPYTLDSEGTVTVEYTDETPSATMSLGQALAAQSTATNMKSWTLAAGTYNVTNSIVQSGNTYYGSGFVITVDNLTIKGDGEVLIYSDYSNTGNQSIMSDDGDSNDKMFPATTIFVTGANVTISDMDVAVMVSPYQDGLIASKNIEFVGNGGTVSNVNLVTNNLGKDVANSGLTFPDNQKTCGGTLIVSGQASGTFNFSDIEVVNGDIDFDWIDDNNNNTIAVNVTNVTSIVDDANGIGISIKDSKIANIDFNVENYTVNINGEGANLATIANETPAGTVINIGADVVVDKNVTIPADVTVNVNNNAKVTVNGGVTVDVSYDATMNLAAGTAIDGEGSTYVSGTLAVAEGATAVNVSKDVDANVSGVENVTTDADSYNALANGAKGEGWSYSSGTLTLDGYDGDKYFIGNISKVEVKKDSTITIGSEVLEGYTNTIFGAIRNYSGNMEITGAGTLTINIDITGKDIAGNANNAKIAAIYANESLTVNSNIVINITGQLGEVAEGYTEAVYGLYATGNISVGSAETPVAVDYSVAPTEALAFAVSGPASSDNITFTNVTGQITGGNRAIQTSASILTFDGCDIILSGNEKAIQANTAGGSVKLTGNSHVTLELLPGIENYNGGQDDRYGIKVNELVVDENSTLVTDGMRLFNVSGAATVTNNGVIIVYGGYTQNSTTDQKAVAGLYSDEPGFSQNVMKGIPSDLNNQYIYLADNAATYNVMIVGSVNDADKIDGNYAFSAEQANTMMGQEGVTEITIVAIDGVADITGLEIASGVTVSIGGTVSGTIGGITLTGITGASYTADSQGNLVLVASGTAAIGGTVSLAAGETLGIAEGAAFNGTFNGLDINFVAGAGFAFGAVAQEGTPAEEPTETTEPAEGSEATTEAETVAPASAARAATYALNNVATYSDKTVPSFGGNMDLVGDISGDDLVLDDANLTTSVTGGVTIAVTNLTISGDVTIGAGVTIVVDDGYTLTIEKDATLSGEGTLQLKTGGTIVNNSSADAVSVNIDSTGNSIKIEEGDTAVDFINALPYYDTIEVNTNLDFTEQVLKNLGITAVNVDDKVITLGNSVNFKISKGATVNFVNSKVTGGTMTVEGTIGIDDSNILVSVNAEKGTVNAVNNVMNVDGNATSISDVGFGKILNLNGNFTIGNTTGNLKVYGEVVVNNGFILTLNQGSIIDIENGGVLSIAGTANVNGTINVMGTIEVAGAMTVGTTGTVAGDGKVAVESTMAMNGTLGADVELKGTATINGTVTGDVVVTMYDGASLNIEKAAGTMEVVSGTAYVPAVVDEDAEADEDAPVVNNKIEQSSVKLENVSGLVITSTEEMVSETKDKVTNNTYTSTFDISGSVTAGTITVNAATGTIQGATVAAGKVVVSDTLALSGNAGIDNSAYIDVTGSVTAAIGSTIQNTGTIDVTGTVEITATENAGITEDGTVNATYYDETTAATATVAGSVTKTYTTFDAAVAAIAGADNTTVTVSGEQTNEVSAEITGTVVVPSGDKLTIGKDSVLTFTAQGYMLNGNTTNKMIVVEGTLVFQAYVNYSEGTTATTTAVENPQIYADVAIIDGAARTYTSLANAIDMAAGEETTITLNQDVTIEDDLRVPENVTIASSEYGISVGAAEKDVTVSVYGSIQLVSTTGTPNGKTITLLRGEQIPGTDSKADYYWGAIKLIDNGYIYLENGKGIEYDNVDTADASTVTGDIVAGAYYNMAVDADGDSTTTGTKLVQVISTVKVAAENSARTDAISIKGATTAGDVSFAVDAVEENDTLTITIEQNASLEASSVNIVPGITIDVDGTVTGTVASTVGAVELNKVSGIQIVSVTGTVTGSTPVAERLTINGDSTGDITVTGTVTVVSGSALDISAPTENGSSSLTVAENATLDVLGQITSADKTSVSVAGTMNINGTPVSNIAGTLNVTGTLAVAGEMTVGGKATTTGTVNVTGTLTLNGESAVGGTVNVTGTEEDGNASLTVIDGEISAAITANQYSAVTLASAANDVVITGTVSAAGTLTINGIVTVGELPTDAEGYYALGTAVTGTLTAAEGADVIIGNDNPVSPAVYYYVKAYYGATVTGLGDDVKSTSYYINGKVYMTVYANNNTVEIMDVVLAENFMVTQDGLALDTGLMYDDVVSGTADQVRNTGLYKAANWFTTSNMRPNTLLTGNEKVGDEGASAVFAAAETVPVTVTITVTDGLTLYIDGIPYASGVYEMSVGKHSVFVNATAGFNADEATISYGGQTIVTGTATGTVEIQADAQNAVILATGATQTSGDITIDVPENPSQEPPVVNVNTGDDKLSLTDYLLIVLVILIVIMAIIVALRLMRS